MADTSGIEINVRINEAEILGKIERGTNRAQIALDNQVLKDSNYYIPLQSGSLKNSGIISTVAGSGLITWRTPYARAQYYGFPHKNKEYNPNATQKWFEVAKTKNLQTWVKIANNEL